MDLLVLDHIQDPAHLVILALDVVVAREIIIESELHHLQDTTSIKTKRRREYKCPNRSSSRKNVQHSLSRSLLPTDIFSGTTFFPVDLHQDQVQSLRLHRRNVSLQ